jgi:hypothetical protein
MAATPSPLAGPGGAIAPYERLVKLIEHELELAGQGRIGELEAAVRERGDYLRTLPRPAPPAAEPLILRARALHGRLSIETQRLAEALVRRRQARRLARVMARTYVPPPRRRNYSTSA